MTCAYIHNRFQMVYRDICFQNDSINRMCITMMGMIYLDQLDVVIRFFEYMCRWLILINHYCFGDEHFVGSRNKSLEKWFSELIKNYTIALESSMLVISSFSVFLFSHFVFLMYRTL